MNEEEAIKQLKQWISVIDLKKKSNIIPNTDDIQAIETVLNLLEKKDKIVDKLIDALMSHNGNFNYCDKKSHKKHEGNCKICLKEYFKNKAEEDK